MSLKVYACNYNGIVNRYVAANNIKQACELMGISIKNYKKYGNVTKAKVICDIVLSSSGAVYEANCIDGELIKRKIL